MATDLLAEDLRRELCRECASRGVRLGKPEMLTVLNQDGKDTGFRAVSARNVCENGHVWHEGEGRPRGAGGENPILLEKQLAYRQARERPISSDLLDQWAEPGNFHREHVHKPVGRGHAPDS
jgi:hypothetical protein